MQKKRHNYFDFLLDKTGNVLKTYIDSEDKEPPPWQLCKQMIEKSLAVRSKASQGITESALAIYESQRIWQPLCLAMTLLSHMKWNLEKMQENFPLHLQQILMEELLKAHDLRMAPEPENFDINKLNKRVAMVHIIYNRWMVKTITKYEELKEKDVLPINLSTAIKESKEQQEQYIFTKLKEYRNLSVDILEKSLFLQSDLLIPFPPPCVVNDKGVNPQVHESVQPQTQQNIEKVEALDAPVDSTNASTDKHVVTEPPVNSETKDGDILMKVPDILDVEIEVKSTEALIKICFDLGCYYFPKEMYSDAWRVFQKAFDLIESSDVSMKNVVDFERLRGLCIACCHMEEKEVPQKLKHLGLLSRLEEEKRNGYKKVVEILKEDNLKMELTMNQRLALEEEFYIANDRSLLFSVCVLNFIRCCCAGGGGGSGGGGCENSSSATFFLQSLSNASKEEIALFFKLFKECNDGFTSEEIQDNLKAGVKLAVQYMTEEQRKRLARNTAYKSLFKDENSPKKKQKRDRTSNEKMEYGMKSDLDGGHFTKDLENDERISKISQLKAQLTTCFEPDTLKDILFELHESTKQKSHAAAYEMACYKEIFNNVPDLLMRDTLHIFTGKARQLTSQKHFNRALTVLNISVGILESYAKQASPGCSVKRVKNVLHHELLWTELKLAEDEPESANLTETMRRCKACISHSKQDPPPQVHVYMAIVIHLLNNKQNQFLVDTTRVNFDINVVDFMQLGYHISAVLCSLHNAAKGLWDSVSKIVGSQSDTTQPSMQGPLPQLSALTCARGPIEEQEMLEMQCFLQKEHFLSIILGIKDDNVLSVLLSCLTSMIYLVQNDVEHSLKDAYSHLWPEIFDSRLSVTKEHLLTVLKPLCDLCIKKNARNVSWLRTIADVYLIAYDWTEAMKCYLELGSITSSFFTRPVANSVWDDQIYRNMILCCEKQRAYTQAVVFSQFTEPIDYDTAFKAVRQRSSDDATECFYDCIWDINILEYLIYTHEKRGEIDKRKYAVQIIGQPDINIRCNVETLQKAQEMRKTHFLRTLLRRYWS